MSGEAPDLARYERYWQPRRQRVREWLTRAWRALVGRGSGAREDDFGEGPWLEPALVPIVPRGPRLSGAVALEPPHDHDDGADAIGRPIR